MGQTACLAIAIAAGACGKGDARAAPHDDEPAKKTYVYTPSDSIAQLIEECVDGRIADACHRLATRYFRGRRREGLREGGRDDDARVRPRSAQGMRCRGSVPRLRPQRGRRGPRKGRRRCSIARAMARSPPRRARCSVILLIARARGPRRRRIPTAPSRCTKRGARPATPTAAGTAARRGTRAVIAPAELLLVKRGCDLKDEHACLFAHLMR